MSSEGMYKEGGQKEEKKKGEEFKSKELMGELQKKQAYKAHARSLSNKDVFSLFSGFKKKWVKGLLGALKRLLG